MSHFETLLTRVSVRWLLPPAIICSSLSNGQKGSVMASQLAIGVARVVLHLPDSGSLKAKRQVVSGLLRRVRAQFQVSAAEVGELDRLQLAELAIATVSGDRRHADEVLAAVLAYIAPQCHGASVHAHAD